MHPEWQRKGRRGAGRTSGFAGDIVTKPALTPNGPGPILNVNPASVAIERWRIHAQSGESKIGGEGGRRNPARAPSDWKCARPAGAVGWGRGKRRNQRSAETRTGDLSIHRR